MTDLHVVAEIPVDASLEEKKRRRGEAIAAALSAASGSPDFRLRMILGEGYQRLQGVMRWIADEIAKDEAKAPGLTALADQWGTYLPRDAKDEMVHAQQQMLIAAVRLVLQKQAIERREEAPLIGGAGI